MLYEVITVRGRRFSAGRAGERAGRQEGQQPEPQPLAAALDDDRPDAGARVGGYIV